MFSSDLLSAIGKILAPVNRTGKTQAFLEHAVFKGTFSLVYNSDALKLAGEALACLRLISSRFLNQSQPVAGEIENAIAISKLLCATETHVAPSLKTVPLTNFEKFILSGDPICHEFATAVVSTLTLLLEASLSTPDLKLSPSLIANANTIVSKTTVTPSRTFLGSVIDKGTFSIVYNTEALKIGEESLKILTYLVLYLRRHDSVPFSVLPKVGEAEELCYSATPKTWIEQIRMALPTAQSTGKNITQLIETLVPVAREVSFFPETFPQIELPALQIEPVVHTAPSAASPRTSASAADSTKSGRATPQTATPPNKKTSEKRERSRSPRLLGRCIKSEASEENLFKPTKALSSSSSPPSISPPSISPLSATSPCSSPSSLSPSTSPPGSPERSCSPPLPIIRPSAATLEQARGLIQATNAAGQSRSFLESSIYRGSFSYVYNREAQKVARNALHILRSLTDFVQQVEGESMPHELLEKADELCAVTNGTTQIERFVSTGDPRAHPIAKEMAELLTKLIEMASVCVPSSSSSSSSSSSLFPSSSPIAVDSGRIVFETNATMTASQEPLTEADNRLLHEVASLVGNKPDELSFFEKTVTRGIPTGSLYIDEALRSIRLAFSYNQQLHDALNRRGLLDVALDRVGLSYQLLLASPSSDKVRGQLFARSQLEEAFSTRSRDFPSKLKRARDCLLELATILRLGYVPTRELRDTQKAKSWLFNKKPARSASALAL